MGTHKVFIALTLKRELKYLKLQDFLSEAVNIIKRRGPINQNG